MSALAAALAETPSPTAVASRAESVAAARAALAADGCALLRDVLDPDWLQVRAPAVRAYVHGHMAAMDAVTRSVGASATAPTFLLSQAPPTVAELVVLPALGALAAALLDVPAVRLLHFCGFFKPAGGGPTPWHRDRDFIPLDTDRIVTAWMPLAPVTPEMGGLVFAAGSHRPGQGADPAGFPQVRPGALEPGDVSFHHGGTLHMATANRTAREREALAVCFFADGARVATGSGRPFQDALRRHCFPTLAAGDLAASPDNPLVFPTADDEGRAR